MTTLLDLVIAYFKSEPESLIYPGMSDEGPLYDLLDELKKLRPAAAASIRSKIR